MEALEQRTLMAADASIAGLKWQDLDGDGVRQVSEPPLAGTVIYLDTNDNGVRDLSAGIEPDEFVNRTTLETIVPGVTLTVLDQNNALLPFPVTATTDASGFASTGRMVFAHFNIPFFNDVRRLKTTFATPVDRLSLDFAGGNSILTEYGRLEAYDADGNLLATYETQPRAGGETETMSLVRPTADIAYAIAYTPTDGGSFGRFDNLKYGNTPEPAAVTAADGSYAFSGLEPGSYIVREEVPAEFRQTAPAVTPDRLFLADINATPNRIVEIDPQSGVEISSFNAPINNIANTSGLAFDGNVLYYIEDTTTGDTLFRLDPNTGAVLGSRVLPAGVYDGLAVLDGLIYAKQPAANQLVVYNPATDTLLPNVVITGATSLADGLGELAAEGKLLARTNASQLVAIDPATGIATTMFFVGQTGTSVRGMTSIGREIYLGTSSGSSSRIDVYDRNSEVRLRQMTGQPGAFALGAADGLDGSHRLTMAEGEAKTGIDFGNQSILVDIRGTKWNDLDGDGVHDEGEPPLPGVTIYLDLDDDGVPDGGEPAATTAADGSYEFAGLLPGDYVVREQVPAGFRQTSPQLLPPRMFALDVFASPAQIKEIDPDTGAYLGSIPIPAPNASTSSGLAFDGQTLYFLSNSSVDTLFELDPDTGAVLDSTILPAGNYSGLAVLSSGVYILDFIGDDVLRFDPQSNTVTAVLDLNGMNPGIFINDGLGELKSTGELMATTSNSLVFFDAATGLRTHAFTLPSAFSARGITSIGNQIFVGYNNRIDLYNRDGQLQGSFPGFSFISGLGAGGSDGAYRLDLLPAQDAENIDFGNQAVAPGEIRGLKWDDADGDGVFDAGELPVVGATVYADANDNGQPDPGEPAAVTDSDGRYILTGVPAGETIVRDVVPTNYRQTFPAYDVREYYAWSYLLQGSFQMTLAKIDPDSGVVTRIGNPTSLQIHGLVRTNSGELFGINGSAFQNDQFYSIDTTTGVPTLIGTTGMDLAFGLAYDAQTDTIYGLGRAPGSNFLNLVQFDRTTGQATVIGPGVASTQLTGTSGIAFDPHRRVIMALDNFDDQFWQFSLDGKATLVWDTENLDGFGLAHNGRTFVHWPRGEAGNLLREVDPYTQSFGATFSAQRFFGMESLDAHLLAGGHRVLVGAGETVNDVDFAQQFTLGTLRGTKWRDDDADGVRDEGEPPLAGTLIYLDLNDNGVRDVGPDAEPFTLTADDGSYAFVDIPASDYVVREEVAFPYVQTFPATPVSRLFVTNVFEFPTRIYELDAADGSVINSFQPPINSQIFNGLAFDGQTLFFLSNDNDILYELDPDTGAVLDSTPLPSAGYDGLAALNGLVYARTTAGGPIRVFDPVSDTITTSLIVTGVTAAFMEDGFGEITGPDALLGRNFFGEIISIDPTNGAAQVLFTIPNFLDVRGITSLGQEIFIGKTGGVIEVYSRAGTLLRTVAGTPPAFGLAGRLMGADDAHRVTLGFNQTIDGLDFGNQKLNEPPVADAGGPYTVVEGNAVPLDASQSSDPDQPAATLLFAWDLDGDGIFGETGAAAERGDEAGMNVTFSAANLDGPTTVTVGLRVTDDEGLMAETTAEIEVTNAAPQINSLSSDATFAAPADPGEMVQISAAFLDAGLADTHTAVVDWGDGTPAEAVTVLQSAGGGAVLGSHAYATGGVYVVTLTVTDDDSGSDIETTLAVVVGAGVHDGVLEIIGTSGDDQVKINQQGDQHISVIASFLGGSAVSFAAADIQRIRIWLGAGDDRAHLAGSVSIPLIVDGGDGDDDISAGAGAAVILGGAGNDRLFGGQGRSIVIGGAGADELLGGSDENILIGGTTSFDQNDAALLLLLEEWNSSRSVDERIANLRAGTGNILDGLGLMLAKDLTVFDDGDRDELKGLAGLDWFLFGEDEDRLIGVLSGEVQN